MLLFKLIPTRFLSQQARNPSGLFGRYLMTYLFNTGNTRINALVKATLSLEKTDFVLEVGFGPGKLIHDIADDVSQGHVHGIDTSQAMYKQAYRLNRHHIAQDHVTLTLGDCIVLPYGDNSVDKACAVNVIYFWSNPNQCLKELHRVLKPKGQLSIGFRNAEQLHALALDPNIFTSHSNHDILELLKQAGFIKVRIVEQTDKPLTSYCAIAHKGASHEPT